MKHEDLLKTVPNVRLEVASACLSGDYFQCTGILKTHNKTVWASDADDAKALYHGPTYCIEGIIADVLVKHNWGTWGNDMNDDTVFVDPAGHGYEDGIDTSIVAVALGMDPNHTIEHDGAHDDFGSWLIQMNDDEHWNLQQFGDYIKELP
jgi:hypothetical protein